MNDVETAITPAKKPRRRSRAVIYTPVSCPPSTLVRKRLGCATDVWADLLPLRSLPQEHFVVYDLDVRHRVIAMRIVHVGTLTGVEVHPREVFRGAILNSAAAMVLAHSVARNIMRLLCPDWLCGECSRRPEVSRLAAAMKHTWCPLSWSPQIGKGLRGESGVDGRLGEGRPSRAERG